MCCEAKGGAMAARFHRNQTPGTWCKTPHQAMGAAWDANHLLPVERALLQKVRIADRRTCLAGGVFRESERTPWTASTCDERRLHRESARQTWVGHQTTIMGNR